jgi:hypothetical protein
MSASWQEIKWAQQAAESRIKLREEKYTVVRWQNRAARNAPTSWRTTKIAGLSFR